MGSQLTPAASMLGAWIMDLIMSAVARTRPLVDQQPGTDALIQQSHKYTRSVHVIVWLHQSSFARRCPDDDDSSNKI